VCSTPAHRHTHGQHRVNLLMQLQCPSPQQVVQFVGSDAAAAAAAGVPAPGDGFVCVQCVARAPWGTCLPVAVVGVEMEAQASGAGSMAAAPQMLAAVTVSEWITTLCGQASRGQAGRGAGVAADPCLTTLHLPCTDPCMYLNKHS
jgi:hypothetical protein